MSPKLPRNLDGEDLARLLCRKFGYRLRNQNGSHIVVEPVDGTSGHISIPAHRPLKTGTLASILSEFETQTGLGRQDLLKLL